VPSYRSAETILACLAALVAQDLAQPYEIIVVDSSPDETAELVRQAFPQVQLVHLDQRSDPARARNIGAQRARGEILAFIDSDCVAPRDWLRRLIQPLAQGYGAVGGAIANGNGERLESWASYFCEFREFLPQGCARDADNLTLGNAAYRRVVFARVGGFPEGLFPQEDQVFHTRLRAAGQRIRLDPSIVVAHTHRAERHAFLEHQRRIGRANARVLRMLDLPGARLARHPWLARVALPALVPLRFARTLYACRHAEHGLVWRRPHLTALCWQGMWAWGGGFVEGAR
jgi:GT2 family glycosyltransferase